MSLDILDLNLQCVHPLIQIIKLLTDLDIHDLYRVSYHIIRAVDIPARFGCGVGSFEWSQTQVIVGVLTDRSEERISGTMGVIKRGRQSHNCLANCIAEGETINNASRPSWPIHVATHAATTNAEPLRKNVPARPSEK